MAGQVGCRSLGILFGTPLNSGSGRLFHTHRLPASALAGQPGNDFSCYIPLPSCIRMNAIALEHPQKVGRGAYGQHVHSYASGAFLHHLVEQRLATREHRSCGPQGGNSRRLHNQCRSLNTIIFQPRCDVTEADGHRRVYLRYEENHGRGMWRRFKARYGRMVRNRSHNRAKAASRSKNRGICLRTGLQSVAKRLACANKVDHPCAGRQAACGY